MMKVVFFAFALVVLSACGGGGSEAGSNTNPNTNPNTSSGSDTVALPSNFQGTWNRTCYTDDDVSPDYVVSELEFSASTAVRNEYNYQDSSCTQATVSGHHVIVEWDTLVYSQTVSTTYGSAYEVDFSVTRAVIDGVEFSSPIGSTEYDILLVNGDGLFAGYLGDNEELGETAATRPTEIDPNIFYTR